MKKLGLVLCLSLVLSLSAAAQVTDVPPAEVSFGYSYFGGDVGQHGFKVGAGWLMSPNFGLVADISHHRGSGAVFNINVDSNTTNFLFGPRVYFRGDERFTPFGHVLFGGSRVSTDAPTVGVADADTSFAWALGGGVDLNMTTNLGVRASAELVRTRHFDDGQSNGRYTIGLVYRFGDR